MDFDAFKQSLHGDAPPSGLSVPLQALWRLAKDDWHAAHVLVQDDSSAEAAWVHAHLHRVEGDLGNAGYWYRRAGKPASQVSLNEEWAELVRALGSD